jgi:hypothetical protein
LNTPAGLGLGVKSLSQRSTRPLQEMTHHMMTRSKTRAAAAEAERYKLISHACELLQRATIDKSKKRIELWMWVLNLHLENLV